MSNKGKVIGLESVTGKEAIVEMLLRVADCIEEGHPASKAVLVLAHVEKGRQVVTQIESAGAIHSVIDVAGLLSLGLAHATAEPGNG